MSKFKFVCVYKDTGYKTDDITGFECTRGVIDGVFIDGEYVRLEKVDLILVDDEQPK